MTLSSPKKIRTITIVGLGLMGGSLAACLRKKMPKTRIVGISRNQVALKTALRHGWIQQGTTDIEEGVQSADLVILCTPVQTFAGLLKKLMRYAPQGVLVTDVGSVKAKILGSLPKNLHKRLNYVSAHPMAGSHARGIEAVNPKLYDQGFVFIIRDAKVPKKVYACIKAFWARVMPRVVEVSAQEHDRLTAEISHMPHAVAACILQAVGTKAFAYAGSGFRDMTRLAAGSPEIWGPIFEANRVFTDQSLARVIDQIEQLRNALKLNSNKKLWLFLRKAERQRKQL